jgi:murein DD-endopeptidase MepM/ murein hydrolase activator NlpD
MLSAAPLSYKMVQDRVWGRGETLLAFLQENMMPLKLYYEMDAEDEKLLADIRVNTIYQVLKDDSGKVEQVLLPLNDELELHIYIGNDGEYHAEVIPIVYEISKKSLVLTFEDIPSRDILNKTENFELSLGVEQLFRKIVNFKKIRVGDRLVVFYTQKRRLGKFFGEQKIEAAMIEEGGKKRYQFLALDGKYYDEKGKTTNTSSFMVPCRYKRISSRFTKKRWHPILKRYRAHHGIDYATPIGTAIKAAYSGKVIFAGRKGGYGKTVVIKHPAGYKTLYAHLNSFKVHVGERVKRGDLIAYSGNTGKSTGPHLHFGLSLNNRWINPALKIVFTKGLTGSKRSAFFQSVKLYKNKINKLLQESKCSSKIDTTLEELEKEEDNKHSKDAA